MASNSISRSPSETVGSKNPLSLSLFSDLTPQERGEVHSVWKSRWQLVSCLLGIVLGILAIASGLLVLTLLPELTTTFIGIACIAIGIVLLITGISLYLSLRLTKKLPPPRVNVRDLQDQLRTMLEARIPSPSLSGPEDLVTTIKKREVVLATFDRELRKQERSFYALLSQETENKHQVLFDLSEFRELQERVSSELGSLYSCYDGQSVVGNSHDYRLLQLESDRNLLIQEIVDLEASRSMQMKNIEEKRGKLKILTQEVNKIEKQIVEEEPFSSSESKHASTLILQNVLQERNSLLDKLAEAYNDLISSSLHQEDLMRQRLNVDKAIQSILDMEASNVLLKRDYKEKYLETKFVIQRLNDNLQDRESAILSLTQEVELLSETIEQLKISSPRNAELVEELRSLRQEVATKKKTISEMEEEIRSSKSLLKEIADINSRLTESTQRQYQGQLLIDSLEQQQRALEAKINEQKEQLDSKTSQERSLKEENAQLKDMFNWESGRVQCLKEALARMQKQMQSFKEEKQELIDSLHLSKIHLSNAQEKIEGLVEEMLLKDEEIMQSKSEIIKLQDLLVTSEEEVCALREAVRDKKNLLVSYQSLQGLISQLEDERILVDEKIRRIVEQNLAAAESARESDREKARLIQELQELRQCYTAEAEKLKEEKAKLEEETLQRYCSYTGEVAHLQSMNQQMAAQLRDALALTEHSEEGALRMLASQLISLSPHIKESVKEEIKRSPCSRMLAFTCPRFFGYIGSDLSCNSLRSGVYLEEESSEGTEEGKRTIVRKRCFREWLFALLGFFSFEEVQSIANRAEELAQDSSGDKSDLFARLEKEFPGLQPAANTLNDWLLQCYPYVTALPIFNSSTRWQAFLVELLQKMRKGAQGPLEFLLPQERAYFQVLSYFSGKLPLILGSIGGKEGFLLGGGSLGEFSYASFGNVSWDRFIQAIEDLLHIRSSLHGPQVIDVEQASEAVLRTTSSQAYAATLAQRHAPKTWVPPEDI